MMNVSKKITCIAFMGLMILFIGGCQSATGQQQEIEEQLDKIAQQLENIAQQLGSPAELTEQKLISRKTEKKAPLPETPANPMPKIVKTAPAAPAAIPKTFPKKAVAAIPETPQTVKTEPETARPKTRTVRAVKVGYFDAYNFKRIPKINNVSELTIEGGVIKIAYKKPYHSQLFLGNFEGEEFLVRVSFAHLKNIYCFLEIFAWPFRKSYAVTPWDSEKVVDTVFKTERGRTGIYVTLSGTQYLKSIIVYRLK